MKHKKLMYTFGKIAWILIGIKIMAWTIFWYYQIHIIGNLGGIMAGTIFIGIGIYALMFYMLITGLFITTKFLVKKRK